MPPKKKAGKKKTGKTKGGTKGPTIIDGVPVSEMTKEQLEGHVRRLQEELEREREERNYYQLERDRLSTFWDVAAKQLEESRAECRVKDRELEETEERHQMEVKIYKQKVKHLLYEQENHLAGLKAENMLSLKVAREEHQLQEQQHLNDKEHLMEQLHEKDKQYQELIRDTKLTQSEEVERLRESFEDRVREMERGYGLRVTNLRHDLQLRLKSEVSETEERKNAQIEQMKRKHEKAFNEIKNYYNDITLNNLAMISTLKEEIKSKEEKLERNEQLLSTVQTENKKLAEPLRKAKEQLVELQRQLGSQEKEKGALISAQAKLKSSQKKVENLSWEVEVLKQKYDSALRERDEIHAKFSSAILEMQQKSGLKYMILEKKINSMRQELDVKEAQLHASSSQGSSGPQLGEVRNVVKEQNDRIRKLERQISQMRLRRLWGDASNNSSGSSSATSSISSGSSSSSSSASAPGSSCFLICTYMVFGLQNIWEEYNDKMIKNAIPYLLPALQTFLTISVYATIAIAINGALAVQSSNNDIGLRQKLTFWIEERGLNGTTLAIIAVILFSAIFNISRWFEFEAVSEVSPDNSTNQTSSISSMKTILKSTPLRENPIYVQYYGLIGSCIIMVFVPTATLVLSCFSLRKAIPDGSQKRKILKIMVIIIVMFILCHVPKVILTGYEIGINPTMSTWSTWALVLKEMSHILLVSYSALNPIAYCGDLIRKKLILSVWQDGFAVCCRCTSLNQGHNRNIHSEFVTMKSIGVTLNGVDPLQQQLHELDAQSRLLTGLQPTDRQRGSGDIQQAVNV